MLMGLLEKFVKKALQGYYIEYTPITQWYRYWYSLFTYSNIGIGSIGKIGKIWPSAARCALGGTLK